MKKTKNKKTKLKPDKWILQSKVDGWVLDEVSLTFEDVYYLLKCCTRDLLRYDKVYQGAEDIVGKLLKILNDEKMI